MFDDLSGDEEDTKKIREPSKNKKKDNFQYKNKGTVEQSKMVNKRKQKEAKKNIKINKGIGIKAQ